jgi:hypothetical protein
MTAISGNQLVLLDLPPRDFVAKLFSNIDAASATCCGQLAWTRNLFEPLMDFRFVHYLFFTCRGVTAAATSARVA